MDVVLPYYNFYDEYIIVSFLFTSCFYFIHIIIYKIIMIRPMHAIIIFED
jgi:hypothetical protein